MANTVALRRPLLFVLALGLLVTTLGCQRGPKVPPGTLVYEGPQAYTLKPGESLPGTDIRFNRTKAEGADFTIGGQRALKQKADSLNWSGSVAPGVHVDLRLRIVWFTDTSLYTVGTARVEIADVDPQPGKVPESSPLAYEMPVAHTIKLNATAPGTTLSYKGKSAQGAEFGGIDGYAFRQVGDSLRWDGHLRPDVAVRQDLRLAQFDEGSARLVGVIHVWITP